MRIYLQPQGCCCCWWAFLFVCLFYFWYRIKEIGVSESLCVVEDECMKQINNKNYIFRRQDKSFFKNDANKSHVETSMLLG